MFFFLLSTLTVLKAKRVSATKRDQTTLAGGRGKSTSSVPGTRAPAPSVPLLLHSHRLHPHGLQRDRQTRPGVLRAERLHPRLPAAGQSGIKGPTGDGRAVGGWRHGRPYEHCRPSREQSASWLEGQTLPASSYLRGNLEGHRTSAQRDCNPVMLCLKGSGPLTGRD